MYCSAAPLELCTHEYFPKAGCPVSQMCRFKEAQIMNEEVVPST